MIKAVIFDFDNTLMDFMRMKKAAVESAVDADDRRGPDLQKSRHDRENLQGLCARRASKTSRFSTKS